MSAYVPCSTEPYSEDVYLQKFTCGNSLSPPLSLNYFPHIFPNIVLDTGITHGQCLTNL